MWENLPKPFFVQAPMADVTDAAFRRVIAKYGKPDVLYSEFVSADGLFKGGYDALIHDLKFDEREHPIVAQFFSRDVSVMRQAAELAEKLGFDGVDINMGCPDRNVCKQGAGAAMIREPERAREIIRETKQGTILPVSVKTRIGYDKPELETWLPELLAENPVVVTVHARTKKEMSKVPAHWDEVKKAVEIRNKLGSKTLIVGNGDVEDLSDAWQKVQETGCDGIMLGRAIYGNPWLYRGLQNWNDRSVAPEVFSRPPLPERLRVLREHIELFDEVLGSVKPFALMKKHFKSYIQGDDGDKALLLKLMETKNAPEALTLLS